MSSPHRGKKPHTLRRSQLTRPFGVGAIYQVSGESFIACDTSLWSPQSEDEIKLDRLAKALRVRGFRQGPVYQKMWGGNQNRKGIPYMRFPEWLFCERCRLMKKIPINHARRRPTCDRCQGKPNLTPMRWIQACKKGHADDVKWWRWAHGPGSPCQDQFEDLFFETDRNAGGGLASQVIRAKCGVSRSLEGIMGGSPESRMKCTGKQPWEHKWGNCTEKARVLLKGASNVHYPIIKSALDIPVVPIPQSGTTEDETALKVRSHMDYERALEGGFQENGEPEGLTSALCQVIAAEFHIAVEEVVQIIRTDLEGHEDTGEDSDFYPTLDELESAEYRAFLQNSNTENENFLTEHVSLGSTDDGLDESLLEKLGSLIDSVVLAEKIREVSALTGFTRIQPLGPEGVEEVKPDLEEGMKFLPATENFGEGIFIQLNEEVVATWESNPAVNNWVERTRQAASDANTHWVRVITPRFIAIHTLAHALIRQLTFECGYSSSALRERIYCSPPGTDAEPMAGILIFTASGDSQGSLGGLVRQGRSPRLAMTILSAIESSIWCSSDPVCSELRTGFAGLNVGACHACSLIGETSCQESNTLLDRNLLIGNADKGIEGLFESLKTFF